ncbi:hypothetical protein D9M71_570200 [compost metagenome]
MGDGNAAQAVGNQDHRRIVSGDRLFQCRNPVLTRWRQPVGLLDPSAVGQHLLPVTLPMILWRTLPARHNQVTDRLVAHGDASCCVCVHEAKYRGVVIFVKE